jgi:tRNA A37 methylthiotransferase MiaB
MAKSKPIGVRFDFEKLELIQKEQNLTSMQSVLDYLMDFYLAHSQSNKIIAELDKIKTKRGAPFKNMPPYETNSPKTLAERRFTDDIPEEIKGKRLSEIVEKQRAHSLINNKKQVGNIYKVLIEGFSKKSQEFMCGRNGRNAMVVFPIGNFEKGNYVLVKINDCTSATLLGEVIEVCKPVEKN